MAIVAVIICYTENMLLRSCLYMILSCLVAAGCVAVPVAPATPVSVADNTTVPMTWPRINGFSVSSDNISPKENVTLSWDTLGGDIVTITPGVGRVARGGSVSVAPQQTTKYELSATNNNGRATGWVTVNVRVSPVLLPDLIITGVTYNSGLLYQKIKNVGTADAGPSNSWLYDMSHMHRDTSWISGLKVGEEKTHEFSNFQYTGNEITICADGGNDIVESNEDNNCYTPTWGFKYIYDMQQYASRATWRSSAGNTQFNDASDLITGRVNKAVEIGLEDGKSYRNVIEMTPPSESYAWIEGLFGEYQSQWQRGGYMIPLSVPANARFTAKVGLAKSAEGGNGVTFLFGLVDAGSTNYLSRIAATYDGKLDSIDVDLSSYAGKKVMAVLRVEAGADTDKNTAVWVDAKISQ